MLVIEHSRFVKQCLGLGGNAIEFRMRSKCILGINLQMQVTTDWQEVFPSLMELTGLPFEPLSMFLPVPALLH